ncbi:MAG: hypothetical protein KC656_34530, partial [Myxococcales bacterium]|nr:hypothetical protein [Myxococcales bacterium]
MLCLSFALGAPFTNAPVRIVVPPGAVARRDWLASPGTAPTADGTLDIPKDIAGGYLEIEPPTSGPVTWIVDTRLVATTDQPGTRQVSPATIELDPGVPLALEIRREELQPVELVVTASWTESGETRTASGRTTLYPIPVQSPYDGWLAWSARRGPRKRLERRRRATFRHREHETFPGLLEVPAGGVPVTQVARSTFDLWELDERRLSSDVPRPVPDDDPEPMPVLELPPEIPADELVTVHAGPLPVEGWSVQARSDRK